MAKVCPNMKEVLKYGIQAEMEAKEFYLKWAENVDDPAEKKELQAHAEMEKTHEEQLKEYYNELYGEDFQRDPELTVAPELKIDTKDFNDVTSRLRIAASSYASEMRATEYYQDMVGQMEECEARLMFEKLLEVEKGHMEETKKRYLDLKSDVAGFHAF